MNEQSLTDIGYSVYLLYQKEVYTCEHSFLQAMMEWLYASQESPLKFYFKNKAQVHITHNGILVQKENTISSRNKADIATWNHVFFNFRHLKEIYVDKRHKDTCVFVSKVSSSTQSNNVWRKSNPSNYESFRFANPVNKGYKKSFLLTILKFKDGPTRLLQSIQMLDSVLVDYNKREDLINKNLNKNSHLNNTIKMLNTIKNSDKNNRKPTASVTSQFYSNVVKSTSRQSFDSIIKLPKSPSFLLNKDASYDPTSTLSRLRNRSQQAFDLKPSRNLSIDRLHQNKNSSTSSLHNFNTVANYFNRSSNSNSLSRQSSTCDLRAENAPLISNRGFLANDFKTETNNDSKPYDKKVFVRASSVKPSSTVSEANPIDPGKNIRIKLVKDQANNFESNISESSENEETESNRQVETVIERKKELDLMSHNDYDETLNTNTIMEDLSIGNTTTTTTTTTTIFTTTTNPNNKKDLINQNTEKINDLNTFNYDFNSNTFSNQNIYFNVVKDNARTKPILDNNKINNLAINASLSTISNQNGETQTKVKDIVNNFNNLNKKILLNDRYDPASSIVNVDTNTTTNLTNFKIGNRFPPPVKTVQNDLNKSNVNFNYHLAHEHPSLTVNVNSAELSNNKYSGRYFSNSNDSITNLNNDINLINNKLTQIVNLLSSSDSNLGKKYTNLEETNIFTTDCREEKGTNDMINNKTKFSSPPVATVAPLKKRTFANMVWPMDPEEEKILRSTSPFVVPEIIMQKPERVKGILKKSNSYLNKTASGFDLTSYVSQSMAKSASILNDQNEDDILQSASSVYSNKKRVDFHENFCYINFFDKNEEH